MDWTGTAPEIRTLSGDDWRRLIRHHADRGRLILGEDTDHVVEAYIITLNQCEVAIATDVTLPPEVWRVSQDQILIGFRHDVVAVNPSRCSVAFQIDLTTPFYEFVTAIRDIRVAICETGAVAFDDAGKVRWRFHADVVTAWALTAGHKIEFQFLDTSPVVVDLETGIGRVA